MTYIIVTHYGYSSKDTCIGYTDSKALFEFLSFNYSRSDFPEELKAEIKVKYEDLAAIYPNLLDPLEDLSITEAMEYLVSGDISFPLEISGVVQFSPNWNW